MKTPFLTIPIYCKPVVKLFLENNFGVPVTLPDEHTLYKLACAQLFKDNVRTNQTKEYPCTIDLNICEKNFRFDGFNINEANTRNFNNGVTSYITSLCNSNLDTLLSLNERQIDWKTKYLELLSKNVLSSRSDKEVTKIKKQIQKELGDHEFTIKKAIEYVVCVTLKLNMQAMNYEAVKQAYFRYRRKKFSTQMSST
jgi:hypothetical protein